MRDPLANRGKPKAHGSSRLYAGDGKAVPLIDDLEGQMTVNASRGDPRDLDFRVPNNIDQQFTYRAKHDRGSDRVQRFGLQIIVQYDLELISLAHLLAQPLDRRDEAELFQYRRIELGREAAHLSHDSFKQSGNFFERGIRAVRPGGTA